MEDPKGDSPPPLLTDRLTDVFDNVGEIRSGVPAALLAQISPSSQARCRPCSEYIKKGELRLGTPMKWRGGTPAGFIVNWRHVTCTRIEDALREKSRDEVCQLVMNLDSAIELQDEALIKKNEGKMWTRDELLDEITKEEDPDLVTINPEDEAFFFGERPLPPKAETPAALMQPLLPFQQYGVGWMLAQEAGSIKGGILADEMGMGKTIQTIAMLLASKAQQKDTVGDFMEPTLVVAPTSAVMQWHDEIRDFAEAGSLKVMACNSTP